MGKRESGGGGGAAAAGTGTGLRKEVKGVKQEVKIGKGNKIDRWMDRYKYR